MYKGITPESIENAIRSFLGKRDVDPSVPAEIAIRESETNFTVAVKLKGARFQTGGGGFTELLRHQGSLDMIKVTYNDKVLSIEEKAKLVKRYKPKE